MTTAIHESNARWLEAVIRFVTTMPHCNDPELKQLLNVDAPDYDRVRARLLGLARQKVATESLVLVTYGPRFTSKSTQMAEYAKTLLRLRHQQRLDARRMAPTLLRRAC